MPSEGKGHRAGEVSGPDSDQKPDPNSSSKPDPAGRSEEKGGPNHVIDVVVEEKGGASTAAPAEKDKVNVAATKKGCLSRSNSGHDQCRICQHPTEEPLIVLGCRCRGELSIAHRSCIEIWFRTRGSNKCEICQQLAANVPSPDSHPTTNYWVWRVNSVYRRTTGQGNHERQCFSPLWVAFALLIGGLLLDVLISVILGVSALPVNIIIGVLAVLGLGTAFRLALECCHEWDLSINTETVEVNINHGPHPPA